MGNSLTFYKVAHIADERAQAEWLIDGKTPTYIGEFTLALIPDIGVRAQTYTDGVQALLAFIALGGLKRLEGIEAESPQQVERELEALGLRRTP